MPPQRTPSRDAALREGVRWGTCTCPFWRLVVFGILARLLGAGIALLQVALLQVESGLVAWDSSGELVAASCGDSVYCFLFGGWSRGLCFIVAMPKIRTSRKKAPAGFEKIEDALNDFERKMRDVENESHEGKRKVESLWPVFRLHHQRSRYVFDMYYGRKEISKELYDWCLKEKIADASLIAKWKKPGYEKLCCLRCIQTRDTNFGTACICRVPRKHLEAEGKVVSCQHCGCRGCASGD